MPAGRGRWLTLLTVVIFVFSLLALTLTGYLEAFSLVARAADLQGPLRHAANLGVTHHVEHFTTVPMPNRSMRVRIYTPTRASRHTVLLVSGLHPAGIGEPRLMALARELAKSRVTVVTPDIPGLTQFAITAALTDDIERAAHWLAVDSGLAPAGKIGLIGISFSGGLAVVAAGRPSLSDRVLYVLSLGGHADLPRVLHYLSSGAISQNGGDPADGSRSGEGDPPPHDYGLAVVLLNVAGRLVPPGQIEPLRDLVRRFLWASYLNRDHRNEATREFAAVREDGRKMPEPSATLIAYLVDRDTGRLGSRLLPHIGDYGNEPALSPSRSPPPTAPVFLLHGRDDNVIPAVESQHLAGRLRGRTAATLLLTDLLSHADTDQPKRIVQVVRLIDFWRDVLAQAT